MSPTTWRTGFAIEGTCVEHAVGIGQLPPVLEVVAVGFRRARVASNGDAAFAASGDVESVSVEARRYISARQLNAVLQ